MSWLRAIATKSCRVLRHRYPSFAFRLVVGGVFIVSGAGKLPERALFIEKVEEFDLLPQTLANFYGNVLPWVEIVIGASLIIGLLSRFAAVVAMLSSLSFIVANSVVLYRGLNLECGCFGETAVLQTRDALIIDCVMLIAAFLILIHKGEFLSLDGLLFRRKSLSASS
jgi:uncharacterized membrane protein YphA (DoxX/SURF4 family)